MDKADCFELMGYRIIGNLCFAIWLGTCTGNYYVQAYTKVGKRFLNCKKNPCYE